MYFYYKIRSLVESGLPSCSLKKMKNIAHVSGCPGKQYETCYKS